MWWFCDLSCSYFILSVLTFLCCSVRTENFVAFCFYVHFCAALFVWMFLCGSARTSSSLKESASVTEHAPRTASGHPHSWRGERPVSHGLRTASHGSALQQVCSHYSRLKQRSVSIHRPLGDVHAARPEPTSSAELFRTEKLRRQEVIWFTCQREMKQSWRRSHVQRPEPLFFSPPCYYLLITHFSTALWRSTTAFQSGSGLDFWIKHSRTMIFFFLLFVLSILI